MSRAFSDFLKASTPHLCCFAGPPLALGSLSLLGASAATLAALAPFAMPAMAALGFGIYYYFLGGKDKSRFVLGAIALSTVAITFGHHMLLANHGHHGMPVVDDLSLFPSMCRPS